MEKNFKIKLIYTGFVFTLMIIFGSIISGSRGLGFEYKIMEFTTSSKNSEFKLLLWKAITFVGNTKPIIAVVTLICIYFIWKKQYKAIIVILFSSLGVYELTNLIKYLVKRIRPEEFFLINMLGFSYPSGHSSVGIAFWWTLSLFNFSNNKVISILIKIFCIIIPFLIGYSRLALGVHWPTDVLFGWLLGSVGFIWSRELFKMLRLDNRISNKKRKY